MVACRILLAHKVVYLFIINLWKLLRPIMHRYKLIVEQSNLMTLSLFMVVLIKRSVRTSRLPLVVTLCLEYRLGI